MKVLNFFVMRFERHFFWFVMAFFAFCLVGSISSYFFIGEDYVSGGKIVSISYSPFLAFLLASGFVIFTIFIPVLGLIYLHDKPYELSYFKWLKFGLICRLVVAPFTFHEYDFGFFHQAQADFYYKKEVDFAEDVWSYPPFYYFILVLAFFPSFFFEGVLGVPRVYLFNQEGTLMENFLLKVPLIIFDTYSALLVRKILLLRGKNLETADRISLYFYLTPGLIIVSAAWGMFDSAAVFFTLLALYFVLKKEVGKSAMVLAISFSIKFYSIILFIPVLVYYAVKWKKTRSFWFLVFSSVSVFLFVFLPYFLINRLDKLFGLSNRAAPGKKEFLFRNMTIYGLLNAFSVLEEVGLLVRVFFTWIPFSVLLLVIILRIFNDKDQEGGDPLFFFTASLLVLLATFYWVNEPYFLWILPFIFMSMVDDVGVDRRICWVLVILHLFYILEHIGVKYFITGEYSKYLPIGGSFSTALGATFGLFILVGIFDLITKGQCYNYLKNFKDYLLRTGFFFISKLHLPRDKINLAKTISLILFFNIFLIGVVYVPYAGRKFFKISGTSYAPFTDKDPILALIVIFLNFFVFLPMLFSYVVSSPDSDYSLPRYFILFMLIFYLVIVPAIYFMLSIFY